MNRLIRRDFVVRAAASLAAASAVRTPVRAAQFEFKCASDLSIDQPSSVRMRQLCTAVEKESAGRIKITYFPSSTLGNMSSMLTQLRAGALHFLLIGPGNLASVVPAADISYVGYAFTDADEANRVLKGQLGDYIRREVAAKGMYASRGIWDSGMLQIGSVSKPIRTVDDLRGFKIRIAESKILVEFFRALGASPTPLAYSATYTGLQTKLIDGQATLIVSESTNRWYEVEKYLSLTNHNWNGDFFLANGDAWKSLPADLQAIVERNSLKYAELDDHDTRLLNASVLEKMSRQGLIVNRVDTAPFRARLQAYYESMASVFGPTAWGLLQSSLGHKLG